MNGTAGIPYWVRTNPGDHSWPSPKIQAALQVYFDVMYECDMEKFDQVFRPACALFTAQAGDLGAAS
jgi:hypothetical protein